MRIAEDYRSAMSPGPDEAAQVREHFHAELRLRNVGAFSTSALAFGFAYLAWSAFDWLLAPDHWPEFLAVRLAVLGLSAVLAALVRRPELGRHVWSVFWLWLFACGAGIALMLPQVEQNLLPYVLGFSLILYGAGLLPFWPPAYAASNVLAIVASGALAFLAWPTETSPRDLLSGSFFVLTGAIASVIMAAFKYDLARRDHLSRSELAATTQRLSGALERLRQADQLQRRFFANITHELRTPLTLILSPIQALRTDDLGEKHQATLASVEANAERLLRLIDDLLDLARVDAGGLRIRVAPVQLPDLFGAVIDRLRPAAERQGVRVILAVEGSPAAIMGDAHRLDMVATNLLGNALKHCREAHEVRVTIQEQPGVVRVEVQDQGPGIAQEDVERIFARFQQGRHSPEGGVGIGLSLARELVELHGGRLQLRSVEGQGSTFSFELPLGTAHLRPEIIERRGEVMDRRTLDRAGGRRSSDGAPLLGGELELSVGEEPRALAEERPVLLERGRRPRVLVAEDQAQLRAFLAELLGREFEVIEAPDGDKAWELAGRVRPDLVLTDMSMPGRSGASLCRAIKADPRLRTIPVVLLTAWSGTDAIVQAYADGADDFVAKPFHPQILMARLRAQLRLRELGAALAHRERLAAVGTLSAGLLHEIRNPLNALLQASRTLGEAEVDAEVQQALVGVVLESGERLHTLTSTLDAHARPAEGGAESTADLVAGMEATLHLLSFRLHGIEVERDWEGPVYSLASASGLNQVFLNLLDNAIKAGARRIRVQIRAATGHCLVRIRDDGRGVEPALLPRIFEPFVTSATQGESSGLGLYVCREIVEGVGGRIEVESEPESGSVFTVFLPLAR